MPFWTIFEKNPQSYSNKITHNNNNDSQDTNGEYSTKNNSQASGQEQIDKMANDTRVDNDNIKEGENTVKTRYRRIVRKPDRLMYQ